MEYRVPGGEVAFLNLCQSQNLKSPRKINDIKKRKPRVFFVPFTVSQKKKKIQKEVRKICE